MPGTAIRSLTLETLSGGVACMVARRVSTVGVLAALLAGCHPKVDAPPRARDPLHQAFEAAFGKPAPFETIDASDDHVVISPQALIDLRPGLAALVSKKEIPGGCRKCGGALEVDYLRRTAAGFARAGQWPDIGGAGVYGRALPWTLRTDLDDGPTLLTRRDLHEGDCSSIKAELISLRPDKPVRAAEITLATTYKASSILHLPASGVSGAIKPLVRGKSFVVTLSGDVRARQVYRREGDLFQTRDFGAVGC